MSQEGWGQGALGGPIDIDIRHSKSLNKKKTRYLHMYIYKIISLICTILLDKGRGK